MRGGRGILKGPLYVDWRGLNLLESIYTSKHPWKPTRTPYALLWTDSTCEQDKGYSMCQVRSRSVGSVRRLLCVQDFIASCALQLSISNTG